MVNLRLQNGACGVFDLFHAGYSAAWQKAKALGDYLLVGVATDEDADAVICGPWYATKAFYQKWRDIHCQDADQQDFYVTTKRSGIVRFMGRSPAAKTRNIIR